MAQSVSVVICTTNRANSLRTTLDALRQLDHPHFEVVVVCGPSADHTEAVLEEFAGLIRVGRCANRNLSESRNVGIRMAAGELVAFIDDDAYPDPAWLDELTTALDGGWAVVGVGGPVYDHTGVIPQTRQLAADRFGNWRSLETDGGRAMSFPGTYWAPYAMGTNSVYRRDALVKVGGFDEEFEYHLDETELCRRLVEHGFEIRYAEKAVVYHKALQSEIRTTTRAVRNRFSILKSKCYFALRHGLASASLAEVCEDLAAYVEHHRRGLEEDISHRDLDPSTRELFEQEAARAFDVALRRYLSGRVGTRPRAFFQDRDRAFLPFPTLRPRDAKLHVALLTDEYLPEQLNGIARTVHTLATGLAKRGHVVRVLTKGQEPGRVDLEEGVWVHRVPIRHHVTPAGFPSRPLWVYSASLHDELVRIDRLRPLDLVQAPNWGSLGVATLRDGRFRTVLSLHTPLKTIAEMDHRHRGRGGLRRETSQFISIEASVYRLPGAYQASTPSIVSEIEERYALRLDAGPVGVVGHGVPDLAARVRPSGIRAGVDVLFVGRLEPRKGIDTLLACVPGLAGEFPDLRFTIVGYDGVLSPSGQTYRQLFEQSDAGRGLTDRVRFTGLVSDSELAQRYADCDIFVAPSRYESFGLILIEAMMFGKPVVACRAGGMVRIVEEGRSGFLVPPGDSAALAETIRRLAASATLRERLGRRSRELYEERYSAARMVHETNLFYDRLLGRETAGVGTGAGGSPGSNGRAPATDSVTPGT